MFRGTLLRHARRVVYRVNTLGAVIILTEARHSTRMLSTAVDNLVHNRSRRHRSVIAAPSICRCGVTDRACRRP